MKPPTWKDLKASEVDRLSRKAAEDYGYDLADPAERHRAYCQRYGQTYLASEVPSK